MTTFQNADKFVVRNIAIYIIQRHYAVLALTYKNMLQHLVPPYENEQEQRKSVWHTWPQTTPELPEV